MSEIQSPPFCVQVELTEGCNLFCDFCGLKGIRKRPRENLKFMCPDTAKRLAIMLADAEKWNPRIEFAMHGEPTLNPWFFEILRIFRGLLPRASLMVTSNGAFVREPAEPYELVREMSKAGLNILAVDCYDYAPGLSRALIKSLESIEYPYSWYPDVPEASPHTRSDPIMFRVVLLRDISSQTKGTHASLNTHCGAGSPPKVVMEPCGKPFRELSIRWNGDVAICCNDWRGEFSVGNIHQVEVIQEIWNHPRMQSARRFLVKGDRIFRPCDKCDARTYRPGLLPDQRGKLTLPNWTSEDAREISKATSHGFLTQPVKRPWEEG